MSGIRKNTFKKKCNKSRKVEPIADISKTAEHKNNHKPILSDIHTCAKDKMKYGLRRNTQLLGKITDGKSWKKSRTPSPSKCTISSLSEQGCEMASEGSPGVGVSENENNVLKMKNTEQCPDTSASIPAVITESPIRNVQPIDPSLRHGKASNNSKEVGHIFGRITETAAKYLPKKGNIGKFFGEKEVDIRISTIDREMAQHKNLQKTNTHHCVTEFPNSELTDRLNRTKQSSFSEQHIARHKSVGCLAADYPPYRLYFLPGEDWRDPESPVASLVRLILCEVSLIVILLLWLLFGALLFYLTEGLNERNAAMEFEKGERSLVVSLATDLRLLNSEDVAWKQTIDKYTILHKQVVIKGLRSSYGNQKVFWTFPGSLLFATSLLTTLGVAVPSPLTVGGKMGALIFTILGFPMHILLLVHLGRSIALKIQIVAKEIEMKCFELRRKIKNVRKFGEDLEQDKEQWPERMFLQELKPSQWLCHIPVSSTILYYLLGCLIFGWWEDFPEMLFFPLKFSNTNYHSSELARFGYACYLEGLVILSSINAVLWRDSPYEILTTIGNNIRFMTNSVD